MDKFGKNFDKYTPEPRFQQDNEGSDYVSEYDFSSQEIGDNLKRTLGEVFVQSFDLSVAQTAPLEIKVPGRGFVCYGYTTGSAIKTREEDILVNVKIGDQINSAFPAKHDRGFIGTFGVLFLTWPAQAGKSFDLIIHKSNRAPWQLDGLQAGVTSINGLIGAVTLAAGANITLTPAGNTITIAGSGGAIVPGTTPVTGGAPYDVLYVDAGGKVNQSTSLFDIAGGFSIRFQGRVLVDNIGANVLDWNSHLLIDHQGNQSVWWDGRQLISNSGNKIVDWSAGKVFLNSGNLTIDWVNWTLTNSGNTVSLAWDSGQLFDISGTKSGDWNQRQLFDNTVTESLDWQLRQFFNTTGFATLDYANQFLLDPSNLVTSLDWQVRRGYDTAGTISFDYGIHTLNLSGVSVLDWSVCKFFDTSGSNSIDANNRQLIAAGNVLSIDWTNKFLADSANNPVIGWSGGLQHLGFFTQAASPVIQPSSSGAQTATLIYTATEQTMLQQVYDAVRALGLMS